MIDKKVLAAGVVVLALGTFTALAQRPAANMSFFVTSSNPKGGKRGGLTGTNEDGTKNADTCKDWTVGDDSAKAMLGHADRLGRNAGLNSWNAIHPSQGCGMEQLKPTGGAGLLYCFATN